MQNNQNKPQVNVRVGRGPRNFGPVQKPKDFKKTMSKLLVYFSKEIKVIISLLIIISLVVVIQVINPKLQSLAIDYIDVKEFDKVLPILITMIILFVFLSIFTLFQGLLGAILSNRIVKRMREDLFVKLTNLPITFFDTHSHGDIMSRMTNDIDSISNTLSMSLGSLFSGILMLVGTTIMMFVTCWQLALLSCSIVILTLLVTKYLSKAMRKQFQKRQVLLGRLNGTVEEMVVGHKTVKAFCMEDIIIDDFNKTSNELTKTGIIADILGGSMGPIMNAINNTGFVIIAAFGSYFAINEIISIGIISAFIIYSKQFSRPINMIASLYGQIQTSIASAERVFMILDEVEEDCGGNLVMDNLEGNIEFKNIDFSYVKEKQVLFDFDIDVKKGQKVALVGATGSGKTTVVNLLMRFYDCDSGGIFIDGVNIKDLAMDELRKNTAIVLQDTILFKDTIINNLKYSNEFATNDEIKEAAKMCHCDRFIMQMKDGYDTILSEGGTNLSQGQRQLLSICRAFIAKPKILILDEATSSVDTRTEKHIQDAMIKLMRNRTSLIIAHRLSTIQDADIIIVMDKGRIVETGNHDDLLMKKGKYFDLYQTQFAGNQT